MWKNYKFQVPDSKKVRYIIHTDAKNEADDQFTIAHALMTDKFDVKGIVACHFDKRQNSPYEGKSAQASYDEIVKVLDLMHLTGQYPIYMGANTGLTDANTPIVTEGAKFIVEEAMKDDPRPLYIGMQGAITDLACAILMEPRICERMTCIWIGGGAYPEGGQEFNLMQDVIAANVVFGSSMPVWQVTKTGYKQFTVTLAELQDRVEPYGKIGKYLFDQMVELNNMLADNLRWPHGESWSLGDEGTVAALLEETEQTDIYTEIPAPEIDLETMKYNLNTNNRKIRVYHRLNARLDLEDLYAKLKINFPERDS